MKERYGVIACPKCHTVMGADFRYKTKTCVNPGCKKRILLKGLKGTKIWARTNSSKDVQGLVAKVKEEIAKHGANRGNYKLDSSNCCIDCGTKISSRAMRCNSCFGKNMRNENNPLWKGNDVNYHSLHSWIRRRKEKPELCEHCHKGPSYDLSNISGEYRRDIEDYEYLCRKCHMESDGRMTNLKQFQVMKN